MDVNRLNQGEKIAAGSAVVLLIGMFLFKWFGVDVPEGSPDSPSLNAWEAFTFIDIVLFVTIATAIAMAFISASQTRLDLPVPLSTVVTALGGLSVLLVLFRLISPPDIEFFGVDVAEGTRSYGVFLGLIAAGALTYGGWLAMQEEGTTFGDAADRFGGGDGPNVGGPGPGAPPDPGAGRAEPPSAPPPPPPPPPSGGQPPPPSA